MEEAKLSDWVEFYRQQWELQKEARKRRDRVMERYYRRFGERIEAQDEENREVRGVRFYFDKNDVRS